MKKIICKLHIDNLSKHRKEGRKKEIRKEEMKEGRKEERKKEGKKGRKGENLFSTEEQQLINLKKIIELDNFT